MHAERSHAAYQVGLVLARLVAKVSAVMICVVASAVFFDGLKQAGPQGFGVGGEITTKCTVIIVILVICLENICVRHGCCCHV